MPKMAVVTFLIVCAALVGAALAFQDNAWKHILQPEQGFKIDPPWLGFAIIAAAVVSLIFFGLMGIGHAMVNAQYADFIATKTPPPPPEKTPEERRSEELAREGYHDHGSISVPQADGAMQSVRLFARPAAPDQQNIINRDVTLRDPQGNESFFNYSVLFHDYSWKEKSDRFFQGKHSKAITLETALQNEYLRRGVEKAPRVVCLGLASSEMDTTSAEDNGKLSDVRGINLCKALFKIGYIKEGPQTAIGVGGGYATKDDVADPDLQRVAIIIGVQHTTRAFSIEAFVLAMNELIAVDGVDLEGYSRTPAEFKSGEVNPGQYFTIDDVEYSDRSSDIVVPVIPKAERPAD